MAAHRRLLPHRGAGPGLRGPPRRETGLYQRPGHGRLNRSGRGVRGQPQRPPLPALQGAFGARQARHLRKAPLRPGGQDPGAPGHRRGPGRGVFRGHHVSPPPPAQTAGGDPGAAGPHLSGEDRLLPALLQAGRLPEGGAAQHLQPQAGDRRPHGPGGLLRLPRPVPVRQARALPNRPPDAGKRRGRGRGHHHGVPGQAGHPHLL